MPAQATISVTDGTTTFTFEPESNVNGVAVWFAKPTTAPNTWIKLQLSRVLPANMSADVIPRPRAKVRASLTIPVVETIGGVSVVTGATVYDRILNSPVNIASTTRVSHRAIFNNLMVNADIVSVHDNLSNIF